MGEHDPNQAGDGAAGRSRDERASDEAPPSSPPGGRTRRRAKRRSAGVEGGTEDAPGQEPALDDEGRERPHFVLTFPRDAGLDRAVSAFERGDYAAARRHAEQLAADASNPRVRRAARELIGRIQPDPLTKTLLAVAVGLWLLLVVWTYTHGP